MIEQFYLFEYMVLSLIPPLLTKMPVRSQEYFLKKNAFDNVMNALK
jgi:hypothetical protein